MSRELAPWGDEPEPVITHILDVCTMWKFTPGQARELRRAIKRSVMER